MKPTMALKPLVFALAAVMAMAAQAGNDFYGGNHVSSATVKDTQTSENNVVNNYGTKDTAKANHTMNGSSGNINGNVAAGDGNQQDNQLAIASSDESFIFGGGGASASSTATQTNTSNTALNLSTPNKASINDSGNGSSGNLGLNVTAGQFNQQKNNTAIASAGSGVATANASTDQKSTKLLVNNIGTPEYKTVTTTSSTKGSGTFDAEGTLTPIKGSGGDHDKKGGDDDHDYNNNKPQKIKVAGDFDLKSTTTSQQLVQTGWTNPVVNNASLTNAFNGSSGNIGGNVSAGTGNMQVNNTSISSVNSAR
ncbi:hypothetical protein SAMN04487857_1128 [Pseudomonas sp. ok272]|uniref:hypothetical protein n=1 Tax=unclassified Pseudomonas TaxID=196821 RepID=UPI0008B70B12|nr:MULTISPECIES: hypothetical protein [unclassified Pseudomonas]SEN22833.1 hypothetical protein SAMN04487857_1128 [Pseudomonas sp. ok272]SFN14123.1 hypothetical protein SAMN04487858_1138 [Pseudomonas sp. ok602]